MTDKKSDKAKAKAKDKQDDEADDVPDDESDEEQAEREEEMGSVSIGEDSAAAPGQTAGEGTVTEGGGSAGGTSGN
jgi:hypothetical protein